MNRLRPRLHRKSVCRKLDAVYAVRQRTEEHPHVPVNSKDVRVDCVPHALAAAVDDLARKLKRPSRRIGSQRGNSAVGVAHEQRDVEDEETPPPKPNK